MKHTPYFYKEVTETHPIAVYRYVQRDVLTT